MYVNKILFIIKYILNKIKQLKLLLEEIFKIKISIFE